MKINWGHKLVFFMILFMAFITTLVVLMIRQDIPLVETDYYEKGINFESELRKYEKSKGLDHRITHNPNRSELVFTTGMGGNISGFVRFYRPSDNLLDFTKNFVLDEYGTCTLNTSAMQKGVWHATFEWVLQSDTIAATKEIYIQ
jgi:hypothetical protein